jgi:hypothetical protein
LTKEQCQFPPGARVLVDGRDEAIVRQCFPQGSSTYLFPHYKVDFVGGDKNVAVPRDRVGVEARARAYIQEAAEHVARVRRGKFVYIQFPTSSWAQGATFRIKKIGREYNLTQVDPRTLEAVGERARYGRKAQIIEDVAHVLEYGTLPPPSGPRW